MGIGRKAKRLAQQRRERKQQENPEQNPVRSDVAKDLVKENDKFTRFYQHIKICPENEWNSFIETLQTDLPTTFRISASRSTANKLLNLVKNEFFDKYIGESSSENLVKPFPLPWYTDNLAWQLNITRKDIRSSESLYKLHNFLIAETETGSISRQEAVSMIPPIVLDVKPHHKVLDTCAAPGSKTAQLIEALHADGDGSIPSGFVVANDLDNARCYMLVHQAKRLNSPCFVVMNEDSTSLPAFKTMNGQQLKFDRILCDVPCTGDGTLRKNPMIWKKWHLGNALNLHGVQYRVARRGAELLEVGGRMVYSTCSLNPIENEAVVHRLLKDSEGALELVDISQLVPSLKYTPGMSDWELSDKDCTDFYRKFEDVLEQFHTVIRPQMFPPSKDEAEKYSLNRCMRILPHFQNTGGFFIAALTKIRPLPWEQNTPANQEKTESVETDEKTEMNEPQRKKRKFFGHKEDPFVFFNEDEQVWHDIKTFFDIDISKLETFKSTQLLTRSLTGKKKNIYFCSDAVKDLVQANEANVKIINTGLKVFSRCDHRDMHCEFRIANEGLEFISHLIGERRRIAVTKTDLIVLLETCGPKDPPELEVLSEGTRKRMDELESGSCLLVFKDDDGFALNVAGWKGQKSLRAYVDSHDSVHMLRLLGADVTKFETNKFTKKNE